MAKKTISKNRSAGKTGSKPAATTKKTASKVASKKVIAGVKRVPARKPAGRSGSLLAGG